MQVRKAQVMVKAMAVRGAGDEKWIDSGSVALVERVLGELEVKMETEFCMRKDVSPATVTRAELTGPVLQLLFYKPVSRILSF